MSLFSGETDRPIVTGQTSTQTRSGVKADADTGVHAAVPYRADKLTRQRQTDKGSSRLFKTPNIYRTDENIAEMQVVQVYLPFEK